MFRVEKVTDDRGRVLVQDPPIARLLFQSTGPMAVVWLILRLFLAYNWLTAFWEKFNSDAWMGSSGAGIMGFWQGAVAVSAAGKSPVTYDWYRNFLTFLINSGTAPWFGKIIVFGELAVGLGILLGAFVGIAAAGGLTMNMAFMLAGSASTNPVLAVLEILLILAWKNAGYIGIDRYLLPLLGTPWPQAKLQQKTAQPQLVPTPATR